MSIPLTTSPRTSLKASSPSVVYRPCPWVRMRGRRKMAWNKKSFTNFVDPMRVVLRSVRQDFVQEIPRVGLCPTRTTRLSYKQGDREGSWGSVERGRSIFAMKIDPTAKLNSRYRFVKTLT